MNKFDFSFKIKKANIRERIGFIVEKCKDKSVLDLGCIRHNAEFAMKDDNWLHGKIRSVASSLVGVDYMEEEVNKLKQKGYNIVYGDVTLKIEELESKGRFDVIVAGDIIEHLSDFRGFFENCKRWLKPQGELIISTPNPFYTDLFHYIAFKNTFLVNPEHTCWICPYTLLQLSDRFHFFIDELFYCKNKWILAELMCETKENHYDILLDKWPNNSFKYKVIRNFFHIFFRVFYVPYKFLSGTSRMFVNYSDYIAVLKLKS